MDVRMVLDPTAAPTRIPRSIAEKIGVTTSGRVEADGKTRTISLSVVADGEGNCPALGLTAIESLELEADPEADLGPEGTSPAAELARGPSRDNR
jgi:hypothetical protein